MIQRIQTIWLLLVAICTAIAFYLPYGMINFTDQYGPGQTSLDASKNNMLLALIAAIIVGALAAILAFKNRKIQKILCLITTLASLACLAFMLYISFVVKENVSIDFGLAGPILSFIFSLLAYQGINKDDKLVKNLDRLR